MYRYVRSMSQSRKNIIGDLEEKAVPLVEHLVKIIVFQERGNLKHWCDELGAFIRTVPKLKSNNRYPTSDIIYHAIWDDEYKNIDIIIDNVIYMNSLYEPLETDRDIIVNFCSNYIEWLSKQLSSTGFVYVRQCTQTAMSILNKYKQGE